jgi:hypothetical protein
VHACAVLNQWKLLGVLVLLLAVSIASVLSSPFAASQFLRLARVDVCRAELMPDGALCRYLGWCVSQRMCGVSKHYEELSDDIDQMNALVARVPIDSVLAEYGRAIGNALPELAVLSVKEAVNEVDVQLRLIRQHGSDTHKQSVKSANSVAVAVQSVSDAARGSSLLFSNMAEEVLRDPSLKLSGGGSPFGGQLRMVISKTQGAEDALHRAESDVISLQDNIGATMFSIGEGCRRVEKLGQTMKKNKQKAEQDSNNALGVGAVMSLLMGGVGCAGGFVAGGPAGCVAVGQWAGGLGGAVVVAAVAANNQDIADAQVDQHVLDKALLDENEMIRFLGSLNQRYHKAADHITKASTQLGVLRKDVINMLDAMGNGALDYYVLTQLVSDARRLDQNAQQFIHAFLSGREASSTHAPQLGF